MAEEIDADLDLDDLGNDVTDAYIDSRLASGLPWSTNS